MKKLLITGISGFLGQYFAQAKAEEWILHGTYHQNNVPLENIQTHQLDLTDSTALQSFLAMLKPDAILHMAALSNPNTCELQVEQSHLLNYTVSLAFAKYAAKQHIPYLFTSTDLVFDGQNPPYQTDDTPQPIMVYGKDKWSAEMDILKVYPNATIVRLPLMYGQGANFLPNWIKKLQNGENLYAFTDEYRTPSYAGDAVKGLLLLFNQKQTGIWHLGGKESVSRFEFIQRVAKVLALDESLILPSMQKDVNMPAPRPANVSLNSQKSFKIGFNPSSLEENLLLLKSKLL